MLTDIFSGVVSIFDQAIMTLMLGGTIIGLVFGIIPGLSGLTALAILTPLCYGTDASDYHRRCYRKGEAMLNTNAIKLRTYFTREVYDGEGSPWVLKTASINW
jgi:uncharacterized membrane protein YuzA (DUF378 family)